MNRDHLKQLLYKTETWNGWRQRHPEVRPDLSNVELNPRASKSTLVRHPSIFQRFQERDFQGIDLHNTDLRSAKVWLSNLSEANLQNADLNGAEIRRSQLRGVDLRGADLRNTQFVSSDLSEACLSGALLGNTHLGYTKLVNVQGLDQVKHEDLSHIDQFSLITSLPLPESFFIACNLQEHTIRMAQLYMQSRPYHTCFISYSRRDEPLVEYLREALTWAGVPSWFAPQDMRREEFQGNEVDLERDLYNYIDEAEIMLLILSPNILSSSWVGKEFQRVHSMISNRKPMIPILVENMPVPDSPEWNGRIAQTVKKGQYSQLNPEAYSKELAQILNGSFLECRDWRNPIGLAYHFSYLLPQLRRTA